MVDKEDSTLMTLSDKGGVAGLERLRRRYHRSRRCGVDTEAIASEIVAIRNRLEEIEQSEETEAEEERARLAERLGFLQSRLSAPSSEKADQDEPAEPDDVQYLPPA